MERPQGLLQLKNAAFLGWGSGPGFLWRFRHLPRGPATRSPCCPVRQGRWVGEEVICVCATDSKRKHLSMRKPSGVPGFGGCLALGGSFPIPLNCSQIPLRFVSVPREPVTASHSLFPLQMLARGAHVGAPAGLTRRLPGASRPIPGGSRVSN